MHLMLERPTRQDYVPLPRTLLEETIVVGEAKRRLWMYLRGSAVTEIAHLQARW